MVIRFRFIVLGLVGGWGGGDTARHRFGGGRVASFMTESPKAEPAQHPPNLAGFSIAALEIRARLG